MGNMHGKYLLPCCPALFFNFDYSVFYYRQVFNFIFFIVLDSINLFHYGLGSCIFCLRNYFTFTVIRIFSQLFSNYF